ncbi:MAG: hypothetical protein KA521_00165 [Crocinitomicaceae bacterium]|nr:hypothetical protein [Crocinitomicaceae bacterium]
MKNFEEKAIQDLSSLQAGEDGQWRITAHVGKDDWGCWEVRVDFEKKI